MLISFTINNWMSFQSEAHFSMVASKERQHTERVPELSDYQTKILPIAAIYGGNASGKTNFFKALSFVKKLVVHGTQPDNMIAVEPFRLDKTCINKPTDFKVELLADETIYEYSFSVSRKEVLEEKLIQVSSYSEKTLFHRHNEKIEFDKSLRKDDFLNFAFNGTRNNQLFLTNAVSQKVNTFRPVYDWFKYSLELIAPDSRFESFEQFINEKDPLYDSMNDILPQLDTGISHLGGEEIPFDNLPFPGTFKNQLQEDIKEGMTIRFSGSNNERFIVFRNNGELIAKKLVAYHQNTDGTETKFDIRQESDGSQRIIDLLPAFLDVSKTNATKVYVIDELDRSLHTLLTRQLIEMYLATCSAQSRTQLFLTTHDALLMDQQLFRRDEMWITERDINGNSSLLSFSEYKDVRSDKDIRKSYLQGRLGGIPKIISGTSFICH